MSEQTNLGATASQSLLKERSRNGLCSLCGAPLTEKEKALEGVGGSYVRCDECVQSIMRGDWAFPGGPEA